MPERYALFKVSDYLTGFDEIEAYLTEAALDPDPKVLERAEAIVHEMPLTDADGEVRPLVKADFRA